MVPQYDSGETQDEHVIFATRDFAKQMQTAKVKHCEVERMTTGRCGIKLDALARRLSCHSRPGDPVQGVPVLRRSTKNAGKSQP